ncbi:hypothetical protein ACIPW5_39070 [Streptomyces sp. NPDC090077]|uniref:hypothetical protein n=1 Tax=Streptomyces sp. NPDC090077 TaxID=3365938 RepID=UPI00380D404C
MTLYHLHLAATETLAFNPFDGVNPSWGPFDNILKTKVGMFLGLAWAIGFVYTAYNLVVSVARLSQAKKGGYGDSLDEAKADTLKAAAATIGLTALPVIYGVLVAA